jgi:hypothetical protein
MKHLIMIAILQTGYFGVKVLDVHGCLDLAILPISCQMEVLVVQSELMHNTILV